MPIKDPDSKAYWDITTPSSIGTDPVCEQCGVGIKKIVSTEVSYTPAGETISMVYLRCSVCGYEEQE